jgi:dTMP kinase
MRHPFVVLEGIDGTGKSTVSNLLAEEISAMRLATPMEPFNSYRPTYSKESWNAETSFEFYLNSLKFASDQIEIITKEMPLVVDRYVASTFAYHITNGMNPEQAMELINQANLIQPTIGFQLESADWEIAKRLRRRGSKPLSKEWIAGIRQAYRTFNYNLVDTTGMTPKEVAKEIADRLRKSNLIYQEF